MSLVSDIAWTLKYDRAGTRNNVQVVPSNVLLVAILCLRITERLACPMAIIYENKWKHNENNKYRDIIIYSRGISLLLTQSIQLLRRA